MRIGFLSTRLKGTDGVSLEVEKISRVLHRLGHETFYCAGELGGYAVNGTLIAEMHFAHPAVLSLSQRAFEERGESDASQLVADIYALADQIQPALRRFILANRLDLIFVQNALAIPMNLPLGVCLSRLIAELDIPTLAHHHDLYWERQRYQANDILDLLDANFPPDLPSIQHITINSIAQQRLEARRGIASIVVPNVHDFATPPPDMDAYSADFRQALGLTGADLFILQPTRVIQRKGIEMAIELVHRLKLPNPRLFITHQASDEGAQYWHWLQREASMMGVALQLVDYLIAEERGQRDGHKVYSLWDAYPHADLVTYPSLYEGFGNALLEAIYFKRLVVINRYPVYNADIRPLGFEFVELEGFVDRKSVEMTRALLHDSATVRRMAEKNYSIAREHYSLEMLERMLCEMLANI